MRKATIVLIACILLVFPLPGRPESLPNRFSDSEFWRLVTELSESGGRFQQQFMSNEDSFQSVIPTLKTSTRQNGVYVGVGSEQNFTYIAATQPMLVFIVDIRRDNLLEHLMYKALFELSGNRADFLSRLFSRQLPSGLNSNASAKALFDAYQPMSAEPALYDQNLRAVLDQLTKTHRFTLSDTDTAGITRIMNAIRNAGPYSLKGFGDATNPTYAQLMAMTDPTGRNQSYLASEENFRIVQKLESENRIIPLVGDFAGDKTIVNIGKFLKEHDATVDVFYVSNVERYLFDDFAHGRQFYTNVAALPLNSSSLFIRSVTTDISIRLGFPLPDGREKWRTFLFPMKDCLDRLDNGSIKGYPDLFEGVTTPGKK